MPPLDGAPPPRLIPLVSVALRWGLHPQTLYRYARSGRLPFQMIAGRWFMAEDDLDSIEHPPED